MKHAKAWTGEVFRTTSVRYANGDDLLTGLGAKSAGGRWNPPRGFRTVYTSLAPETASAEYLAQQRYYGWPLSSAMPSVSVAIEVSLKVVLDLTEGPVRRALNVSGKRMMQDDWRQATGQEALTQALGRAAYEARIEAILAPSTADRKGTNLIVFPENLSASGGWLRIINRDQLPPPPS